MARTSPFSSLFSLRQKHISAAFSNARHFGSIRGIKILHATSPEQAKSLIVPTRAFKGHVARNKTRRQIKAIIYEHKLLSNHTGTFIVLLYPLAKEMSFETIKAFLIKAFARKSS